MIQLSPNSTVFLAVKPVDMRKQFDSLWAVAQNVLNLKPKEGAICVFINKTHSRCKILACDKTGTWVCAKRLEKGTFAWPKSINAASATLVAKTQNADENVVAQIEPVALSMLLEGIDLRDGCRRPWFRCD
jgi:transposase